LLGKKCEETEGVAVVKKIKDIQQMILVPLSSPNCETDWNYNEHGKDWRCNCDEGRE
jgi:hypothetical protein